MTKDELAAAVQEARDKITEQLDELAEFVNYKPLFEELAEKISTIEEKLDESLSLLDNIEREISNGDVE